MSPSANDDAAAARERVQRIADESKAPGWLRAAVSLIADNAAAIPAFEEDRAAVPEYIYRH